MANSSSCTLCGAASVAANVELYAFPSVTSDCRPWQAGRSVSVCPECAVIKRVVLPEADKAFADVYAGYAMFKHSSMAADQMYFGKTGPVEGRTQKILKFIETKLPQKPATVLDIGSGSGAGLLALANQFPSASIQGFEPNDRPAERQKFLPDNVTAILNTRPAAGQTYDLVTLFHVFEHIGDLEEQLAFIHSVLAPKGHVLIQVPYPAEGAFDLVIADHLWHFSKKSLAILLAKVGYRIIYLGNELIEKELTLLATKGAPAELSLPSNEWQRMQDAIRWLAAYQLFLGGLKNSAQHIAIYGTGPAAAWAGCILGSRVCAYIDDDATRTGSIFNGRPVLSPREIDAGMRVIAPFPDKQAEWITQKNPGLTILLFKTPLLKNT